MNRVITIIVFIVCANLYLLAQTDYSDAKKITISEPRLAKVNITGVDRLPETKTDDLHAWLDYSDDNGINFRKRIILNAQGASSLQYPKKNLSICFCEDEWIGDKTTSIKIGNWVNQDEFHFKASWIDTFRGGLSVFTAYRLYQNIVDDEEHILQRAGLKDYSSEALCHPDGFPCIIYFNGDFHGIYAWQLKKHRKNMGMEKNNPKHVWFQIDNYQACLDMYKVIWDGIEVKNPKEPTDESKQYIENLAHYGIELDSLQQCSSDDVMRQEIAVRYDVTSAIDFIIHGLITSNIDGFDKNINFFTYDGIKWFMTPYDLDETFGNSWLRTFQFTPMWSYYNQKYDMQPCLNRVPFRWIIKYYRNELEQRYATLRKSNVITTDNIMSLLQDWNNRVGSDNYEMEYTRWDTCPSNTQGKIDDNWEWLTDWTNYLPTPDYSDTITYHRGDTVCYNLRMFIANTTTTGIPPVAKMGYTDTEERVRNWLNERIDLEDIFLHYSGNTAIDQTLSSPTTPKRTAPIKFLAPDNNIYIKRNNDIYNLAGQKIR